MIGRGLSIQLSLLAEHKEIPVEQAGIFHSHLVNYIVRYSRNPEMTDVR